MILLACDSTSGYQVAGTVTVNGAPEAGVEVVLDDGTSGTVTTGDSGRFELDEVPGGSHTLAIAKTYQRGNFSELSRQLEVVADVDLELLELQPILLAEPTPSQDGRTMRLSWSAAESSDFREYRLYTHDSAELIETSGELIFVGTERAATEFVHAPIDAGQPYFYQAFVMDDAGRLGGSNVVSVTAPLYDLILDGGFEESDSLDRWDHAGPGSTPPTLVTDLVHQGNRALQFNSVFREPCCSENALDTTYRINLVAGTTYELSAWMKAGGILTGMCPAEIVLLPNASGEISQVPAWIRMPSSGSRVPGEPFPGIDWTLYSAVFEASESGLHHVGIYSGSSELWIDEVSLRPQPH